MLSEYTVNFGLDVGLHVLILFTFLTIFFFAYISKLEKQNLDQVTSSMIEEKTDSLLNNVKDWQNKLNNWNPKFDVKINWNKVDNLADTLIKNSEGDSPEIKENNQKLFRDSIIFIVALFMIFIGAILYFSLGLGYHIHFKHILIMNAIIFGITGLIEYLFFVNVASKYVPVTPDFTTNTILDRVKKNLNK